MKLKLNLYRTLLVISFLIINFLLIYGISATWSYLNTGADKATILHTTAKIKAVYQPKVIWNLEGQKGRPMEQQILKELEEDYKSAWYVKYNALASNNPFGLEDYYTVDAQKHLHNLVKNNTVANSYIRGTSISHAPELLFYSLDGKLVVFNDKNVETFEELYIDEKLINRESFTSSYKVTMLLEDGFWRIRQMVKINPEARHKKLLLVESKLITKSKGINYYPKEHPWNMFGKNFNRSSIDKDFSLIKKMELNAVRIFIPYKEFGAENPKKEHLKQLITVLDIAEKYQLKVMVTLFDFYGNYDVFNWTLTQRHAEAIVNATKTHKALLGWDIKNEPDLDFESRGKENVTAWLSTMAKQIKLYDVTHPITIGWSSPEAAVNLSQQVDFVSFHYYKNPEELEPSYKKLKDLVPDKPLVLQEYGYSSYNGIWSGFTSSEQKQSDYLNAIQKTINKEELPFFVWTLYDFEHIPNSVAGRLPWRKTKQKYFGLLDKDGKPKKAYKSIIKNKKGSH